ncbi:hypothetical protein NC651_008067 [Populus alba x Populus x berolinensis]|nr:hypothetical protein NC651_008067 [Populus alba x Populus x berolinensis]
MLEIFHHMILLPILHRRLIHWTGLFSAESGISSKIFIGVCKQEK